MSERKPPGVSFESWVDRQIREASERGEFENLRGAGRPIPGLDGPHDDLWWVKQKLRREQVSWLPPSLVVRKQAEDAIAAVARAGSEAKVRRIVEELNEKIREAIRSPSDGPPVDLVPFDVERVVERWRSARDVRDL